VQLVHVLLCLDLVKFNLKTRAHTHTHAHTRAHKGARARPIRSHVWAIKSHQVTQFVLFWTPRALGSLENMIVLTLNLGGIFSHGGPT
jgi:hypothetical protein